MTLLRQSTLNQMNRIEKEIKRQGGTIDHQSPSEKGLPNGLWTHDPFDANTKGNRKISTYDDMFPIDIPDATESEIVKTTKPTKLKKENKNMKNVKTFKQLFENTDNDTPIEIMRNMKTIRNWDWAETPNAKKERNILLQGKYIETKSVKGFISRIEGTNVFIESVDEPMKLVKISLKEAVKGIKTKTKEKNIVADLSLLGPSNSSKDNAPSVSKSETGFAPNIDAKASKANDQKLSNKINKEKSVKSFSDLAKDFDSKIIKTKKKAFAPKIDNKGIEAKDQKITKINNKEKFIKKLSDLSIETEKNKTVRGKHNTINNPIDGKSTKMEDNKITRKNTKIKTFKELTSKINIGPKSKK